MRTESHPAELVDLALELPSDVLVRDSSALARYGGRGLPLAIVLARTTADVQTALRWASDREVPVVPTGTGSRLNSEITVDGALVVSVGAMTEVRVQPDGSVVARAGAVVADVVLAAASTGGQLPAAGPTGTIGGEIATDTRGVGLRSNAMADHVVEMQVVLADGTTIRVAGGQPDGGHLALARLFAGSEGTLGVITEITLRPTAGHATRTAILAVFSDAETAAAAALEIAAGARPGVLELINHASLTSATQLRPSIERAVLLISCSEPDEVTFVEEVCMSFAALQITVADDPGTSAVLLEYGTAVLPALRAIGTTLPYALSVPVTRLPDFMRDLATIEQRHGSPIAIVASVDDGIVHACVVHDRSDEHHATVAVAMLAELLDLARDAVHAATGDQGSGQIRHEWLTRTMGAAGAETDHGMKLALDPLGIMNPSLVY